MSAPDRPPPGDDGDRAAIAAMRAALPRTWYPFFARFPRPTAVQSAAWRPILDGRDAVVCSPTATGKTEAVLAPLVERHLGDGASGVPDRPTWLVVSPTRALVNDLVRRVRAPLDRIGLRVDRKTGDDPAVDEARPPQVIVTTPESLDSLLARRATLLKEIRAVVLDELHILDGTTRGDQTRILLERLRAVVTRGGRRAATLQGVASSATVHAPEALAARYLDPTRLAVVAVPGRRPIDCRLVDTPHPPDVLAAIERLYGPAGARKILVFVPGRADVEALTAAARERPTLRERAHAHHGSLSRTERERVEARFLADPSAICFATMTLELGIDIGDVDLVALLGPPPSVSSFLQRIGRGNRRTGTTRVLALVRDAGDRARFRHLAAAAREGDLLPPPYVFRPSVLVQQAGSLLFQSPDRFVTPAALHARLPAPLRDRYGEERLGELFVELVSREWLAPGRGGRRRHVAGPTLERAFVHATLHTNLAAEVGTVEVVDDVTGRSLGQVRAGYDQPREVSLGGRARQVVREADGLLRVHDGGPDASAETRFAPRGAQTLSRELALGLRAHLGLPADTLPFVEVGDGAALFHFQGSLAGAVLARHWRVRQRWKLAGSGGALAVLLREPPASLREGARPPLVTAEELEQSAAAVGGRLARLAAAGPFHKWLPGSWQQGFLGDILPAAAIARAVSEARVVRVTDPAAVETLTALAAVR